MINLKIDPEFQSQIPLLTDDEFKQLEENILKEGKLLSPLIVWNNTLVDGHNRYEIVQEHPEVSFSTMPLPFESREEREFAAWQAEQAHHANNEKQEVPACRVSVKQFSKNDTATACQDWLRSTRLGRGSIKSHVRTVKVLGMGLFAFQERIHLWKGVTH